MTTYNTGNPVPSGDARDRFDNSQTLDEVVNENLPTTITRTGKVIKTFHGMGEQFDRLVDSFGFTYAGDYIAGLIITLSLIHI